MNAKKNTKQHLDNIISEFFDATYEYIDYIRGAETLNLNNENTPLGTRLVANLKNSYREAAEHLTQVEIKAIIKTATSINRQTMLDSELNLTNDLDAFASDLINQINR